MGFEAAADGMPKLCGNHFHIDHQLGRAHERVDWPVYSPRWWLAGQEAGDSNVSGRVNPRMWWHWRSWGHQLPIIRVPYDAAPETLEMAKRYGHFGNHLVPSKLRDRGLEAAIKDPISLGKFLEMIAGEAIERWLLPGVCLHPGEQTAIEQLWKPGLADWHTAPTLADYPFNHLVD